MHTLRLLPSDPDRVRGLSRAPQPPSRHYTVCNSNCRYSCCILHHCCAVIQQQKTQESSYFKILASLFCWPTPCLRLTMTLRCTTKILKMLSSQISSGNAKWAIAVANEYMQHDDPVRVALLRRAREQGWRASSPLDQALENGSTLSQLTEFSHDREELGKILPLLNQARTTIIPTLRIRPFRQSSNRRIRLQDARLRPALHMKLGQPLVVPCELNESSVFVRARIRI